MTSSKRRTGPRGVLPLADHDTDIDGPSQRRQGIHNCPGVNVAAKIATHQVRSNSPQSKLLCRAPPPSSGGPCAAAAVAVLLLRLYSARVEKLDSLEQRPNTLFVGSFLERFVFIAPDLPTAGSLRVFPVPRALLAEPCTYLSRRNTTLVLVFGATDPWANKRTSFSGKRQLKKSWIASMLLFTSHAGTPTKQRHTRTKGAPRAASLPPSPQAPLQRPLPGPSNSRCSSLRKEKKRPEKKSYKAPSQFDGTYPNCPRRGTSSVTTSPHHTGLA